MIADQLQDLLGVPAPPSRIVWCISFPTLPDIEGNVGADIGGQLKRQICERVRATVKDSVLAWEDHHLYLWSTSLIDDRGSASDVAGNLIERFSFNFGAVSSQRNEITIEQDIFITPSIGLAEILNFGEKDDVSKGFLRAQFAADAVSADNGQFVMDYRDSVSASKAGPELFLKQQAFIKALRGNKLRLAYQPKVEIHTGLLYGFEALIRPPEEKFGALFLLSPAELVQLSISTNTLTELTAWVIETALSNVDSWRLTNPYVPFSMSVNVLPRTLIEGWEAIVAAIPKNKNHGLIIEITEEFDDCSGFFPLLTDRVSKLQLMGVEISVDDFGKGMSNIDRLSSMPCDEIKLDALLIKGVLDSKANAELVGSMINYAANLGIRVVAEGIETNAQWHFLSGTDCQLGQGFFISKPLFESEIYKLIKRLSDNRMISSF